MTELRALEPTDGPVPLDDEPGFTSMLGLVLTSADGNQVRGWGEPGPQHLQNVGYVHGGWYSAVVETVASIGATLAVRDRGQQVFGVSNYTDFLRPHQGGRLDVTGRAVHQGRTQQLWEVHLVRPRDAALVARGHVRLQNVG